VKRRLDVEVFCPQFTQITQIFSNNYAVLLTEIMR